MVNIIELKDFDRHSMAEAKQLLIDTCDRLGDGGIVSFTILSWNWVITAYGAGGVLNDSLSSLLFVPGRRSIWNELSIVKALFDAGFAKVWTGHLPREHESILGVKAIKSDLDIIGLEEKTDA